MEEKYQWHDGVKFCRDEATGYYLNGTLNERAHRWVWTKENGSIPDGMHIHHKDEDKSNNVINNLEMLTAEEHLKLHGQKKKNDPEWLEWSRKNLTENARPKASEWHKSEEGRAKHKEIGFIFAQTCEPVDFVCEQCKIDFKKKPLGNPRFCSNACKAAYRRDSGVDDETRSCPQCNSSFVTNKYSKQICCGRSCSNSYRVTSRQK